MPYTWSLFTNSYRYIRAIYFSIWTYRQLTISIRIVSQYYSSSPLLPPIIVLLSFFLPSSSLRWSLRCSGEQAKTSPQAGQAAPTAPQKRQGPCFPPPMSGIFSPLIRKIRFCLLFLLSCHFVRSTATASLKHLGIRPKAKVAPALTFSNSS